MQQVVAKVLALLAAGTIDKAVAADLVRALRSTRPGYSGARDPDSRAIAVIGMAAQMPGGVDAGGFWDRLVAGAELVTPLPAARRELCAPMVPPGAHAGYLSGAWLDDIDEFDAAFFGITPADARSMDPQQRRFTEVAYHCWEDAGRAGRIRGTDTGVYVSVADGDYADAEPVVPASAVPGRVSSFAASRLSFLYDLTGPAYTVSSTCSSSMVALHDACLGLLAGDCAMALVGGANIFSFPVHADSVHADSRLMDASGIMSPTQRCRPFDEGGDGIGRGEGVVAFLLKPLARALDDGDRVRAVIRSTAVNNDGASATLTAPNPRAHSRLLELAWKRAGISPESLAYLEAHGTGTELGDPIEVRGITDAVRAHTHRRQFIAMGTVKGNIGHLMDGAAGLAGLLKAILVLEHRMVPPTVGLDVPNPHIDFLDSPIFVPTTSYTFPHDVKPLRAGVSCFGFNGTNAHVVLEQAPARPARAETPDQELVFPVSAASEQALREVLARHSRPASPEHPRDVAYTLTVGREHLAHRVAVRARTTEEFRERCAALAVADAADWPREPGDVVWSGEPGAVVTLPHYPFTRTRHWLDQGRTAPAAAARARNEPEYPAGTLERCLLVMSEALGLPGLEPADNFLALGGSSLAALQVQSVLLRTFGWPVPLADILAADDFAALAALIDESVPAGGVS